jgi:SlyX protein
MEKQLEQRLETLEMMLMHHEETIERLSQELHKQQAENSLLSNTLEMMQSKLQTLSLSLMASEADETPPPHY